MWIPFFPFMRSEANWEDAATFKPERFLEEGAELAFRPPSTSVALDTDLKLPGFVLLL